MDDEEEEEAGAEGQSNGFLGGCLRAAEAGANGDVAMHQNAIKAPNAPTPGIRKGAWMICPGGLRSVPGVAGLGTS